MSDHDRDEHLGPDAEVLERVAGALRIEMPPGKADAQRARIRAAIASPERYPDPGQRPSADIVPIERARPGTGRRRAAVALLAAVMLLTLGSGSALAASADTKPGDALYGVKRASERIALALRLSPESKASLHLKFAERRIDEIDALAAEGKDVTDLAADFAEALEAAAGDAKTSKTLTKILERTQKHIAHLNEILDRVPEQAQNGLEKAIERAEEHEERTEQRRTEQKQKDEREGPPGKSGDRPGKKNGR